MLRQTPSVCQPVLGTGDTQEFQQSHCDAELEEAQPSSEASAVGSGAEQKRGAKKGRKGKNKGRLAAVQEAESTGSTSTRPSVIMDPSKGMLCHCSAHADIQI